MATSMLTLSHNSLASRTKALHSSHPCMCVHVRMRVNTDTYMCIYVHILHIHADKPISQFSRSVVSDAL